jgi:hypothetical protein
MKRSLALFLLVSPCLVAVRAAEFKLGEAASSPASPIAIKIKHVSPIDIVIDWKNPTPGAYSHAVEWGTKPDDEFVPLDFFPPSVSSYKHPDLMWSTPCFYRIRALYGPASNEVEVRLSDEISDSEYKRRHAAPEDYRWAGPQTLPVEKPTKKHSIRGGTDVKEGAPTNLKATIMPITVSAFQLTWTDNSSDEDGFLIEEQLEGEKEFKVRGLVEPNINSFGWAFGYPTRQGKIRVRAYYYSAPSELLSLTTGPEPTPAPAEEPAKPADAKP